MKKRYDATMRELFDPEPAAWLEFFGVPVPDPALAQVIDSNVSTVTAETDKLLRRGGPEPIISTSSSSPAATRAIPTRRSGTIPSLATSTANRSGRCWCCCVPRPTGPS